ncbi:MAG TPA: uroporphyrinogen-III synthase [Sideroxyarcus sp.]|nr:uroporphyrinogen-III synthase [Sideroxyarcus sp.]
MAERPLAGFNIVVTRPREQAVELARSIERLGGNALSFPLLEIVPVADQAALCEQLFRLNQADLAIFISPNAVRYGMAAMRAAGVRLPSSLSIATVGQGSAKTLHEAGVERVIAPRERFDSEGLLALAALQHVAGKRVMIFRGNGGRELLGDTLKARGAMVEYVSCYQRNKPAFDGASLLQAAPDAITVTSSEALEHLREMLGPAAAGVLAATPLFAQHPRIAEAARQQGWRQVIVTGPGDDGLLGGLIAWAHSKREQDHE